MRQTGKLFMNIMLVFIILKVNYIFNLNKKYEEVNDFQYVPKSARTGTYGITIKMHNKIEYWIRKLSNST